jgi:hypothetical protein
MSNVFPSHTEIKGFPNKIRLLIRNNENAETDVVLSLSILLVCSWLLDEICPKIGSNIPVQLVKTEAE